VQEAGQIAEVRTLSLENFALRLQNQTLRQQLILTDEETRRLRLLASNLLTRQAALLEQLRRAQATGRQVSPEALAISLSAAVERAAASLEGRTIGRARAQIRAMLQIEGGDPGLVLGDPRSAETASLSTVTFDVTPLAPKLAQEAMLTALSQVENRLLHLQTRLDRDVAADAQRAHTAVQVEVSLLLTDPPDAPSLASRLVDLTSALLEWVEWLPDLGTPARELERCRASLSADPSDAEVAVVADAIEAVAIAVASAQGPTL
jgi:hypothetical protein